MGVKVIVLARDDDKSQPSTSPRPINAMIEDDQGPSGEDERKETMSGGIQKFAESR